MSTKFEVGKQYNGWSSNSYNKNAPPLVVVEISPDRSYLMGYNPDEELHKLEKYKIKTSDWNEKVIVHPDKWTYFVWRSDKAVKDVDISNPDWVNAQTYRRKQGAAKANKTKSDKAMLKAFANQITLEQFCKAQAVINKTNHSYLLYIPDGKDIYERYTNWKKMMEYYKEQKDFDFYTSNPRLAYNFGRLSDYPNLRNKYCFVAEARYEAPPDKYNKWGGLISNEIYCFIDEVYICDSNGIPIKLPDKDFTEIFGDIEV